MIDPAITTFRNSLREFRFVCAVWAVALVYVVGYCYLHGYQHDPEAWVVRMGWAEPRTAENFRTVLGFPDWIFWGLFLPWIVCSTITMLFGLFGMKDDDLGLESEGDSHA